ncbi:hypothetical protein IJG78_02220 [Candidatus Saccharibacteria bacterium]|nr:hypothetical protein [Candidatus Saccharibacteria bacterium]
METSAGSNPVPSARKYWKISREGYFLILLACKKKDSSLRFVIEAKPRSGDPVPSAITIKRRSLFRVFLLYKEGLDQEILSLPPGSIGKYPERDIF